MKRSFLSSAACLVFALSACKPAVEAEQAAAATNVKCVRAATAKLQNLHVLRGTVVAAPDDDIVVSSQVPGRVQKVLVREGDTVPKNAVIAVVETQPLTDALRVAQAQLDQSIALQENANITLQRAEHMYTRGIAPRQQVDDSRAHLGQAAAAVASAIAQRDAAQSNLGRAKVTTSTDGVVLHVMRRDGELVDGTPSTPIAEVADPNDLEFLATALPVDLMALQPNQTGSIAFEALPGQRFAVRVGGVPPAVDPNSGTATLRLVLPPQIPRPPLGLFGAATIGTGDAHEAVVVPPASLRTAWAGGSEVVVCEAGRARVQKVQTGQRAADQVEILDGLRAGDRVVVDNVIGLSNGAPLAEAP